VPFLKKRGPLGGFAVPPRSNLLGAPLALAEAQRRKNVLSSARLFIATCCFVGVQFHFGVAGRWTLAAHALLLLYLLHSLVTAILVRVCRDCGSGFLLSIHSTDVVWPALLSLFTGGLGSPCLFLFGFPLFGAAYRWVCEKSWPPHWQASRSFNSKGTS
jgi:hypothetical protein